MAQQKFTEEQVLSAVKSNKQIFDPRIIDDNTGSKVLWTSESVDLAVKGLTEGYKLRDNPFLKTVRNAKLRKANIPFRYSEDELIVLAECMQDKLFYGNNFGKLKDGAKGWVNITLRDYQENLLNMYTNNRWNLIMFPRQSGKTVTTIIEIAHFLTFNTDKDCVVIAQSDKVVNEILAKLKEFFNGLPFFLQPGFVSFNAKGFVLENGCRLSIGIASESVVQGFSLDLVYIDEAAYIKSSMWGKFWTNIYPTLINNPESRCIITSTPNGRNHFYELWQAAILKMNRFVTYRIYWQDVPGRDEQFRLDTIANIGEVGWLMGFECSFDTQLKSVFGPKAQTILRELQRAHENAWDPTNYFIGEKYGINFVSQECCKYSIRDDFFLLTIDIGEGLGQDYSVLKIKKIDWNIDKKRLEYTTVGVLRNNEIGVDDFAETVAEIITFFDSKKIKVVVENNTYGGEFFQSIKNLRNNERKYSKLDMNLFAKFYRTSKKDFEYGIRWNDKNKALGVKSFVTLTTNGIFNEWNPLSIEEYMNFGRTATGTYKASYGHDDTVMPDVTAAYFVKSKNLYSKQFLDYVETELRFKYDDERIEIKAAKEAARKKEEGKHHWRGFTERDSSENLKNQEDVVLMEDDILFI